jgi:hypothetical protein
LLTAVLPFSVVNPAKATTYASIQWGKLQNDANPPNECGYEACACINIDYDFPPSGWTWFVENLYDFDTYAYPYFIEYSTNVYYTILFMQSNNILTDNFWVGDYCGLHSPYSGALHWTEYGIPSNPPDYVWDAMIGYCASQYRSSTQVFDFIWTCSCGGCYWYYDGGQLHEDLNPPNPNPYSIYGCIDSHDDTVGMPQAWTGGLASMSTDGYRDPDYGPYCYIGFEGCSRYLYEVANPNTGATYYDFLLDFYAYATGQVDGNHHSINDSLDWASNAVWGETYGGCPLDTVWTNNGFNCRMRVFGDGNYYIPW